MFDAKTLSVLVFLKAKEERGVDVPEHIPIMIQSSLKANTSNGRFGRAREWMFLQRLVLGMPARPNVRVSIE
jgi:hypothetical protein